MITRNPHFTSNAPHIQLFPGKPAPYGALCTTTGVNFAIFSKHATEVTLCLFTSHQIEPILEIKLDSQEHRTGNVWHIFVKGLTKGYEYGYKINGPDTPPEFHRFNPNKILLDPYAHCIASSTQWGKKMKHFENESMASTYHPRGCIVEEHDFDWEGVKPPRIPLKDLIIYEMHVRGFTQDPSSKAKHPGTFLGIIEKIPYLKSLGINAVELLPVHEFNEMEYHKHNPITQELLFNYWGYSTVNFFSPMNRYCSVDDYHQTRREFKMMVKELHRNGIEVILDVVFNHTAEGNEQGPTYSFKGIDNSIYYLLAPLGQYMNYSGCGNTVQGNHSVVQQFIRDSLRYWVTEMHVDGFRFDLASILTRGKQGVPLSNPPLVQSITEDPLLADIKLIAEAWDAGGLYQVGNFPAEGGWAEWNGQYRDHVRRFIKGEASHSGNFATRIAGSQDLYGRGRHPFHSINFITAHDGFSLADLVSYNHKHNIANGENNQDGANDNESWNCGVEGETKDSHVLELRRKQLKNFHLALIASQGVPMINMGDEYGHTKRGNNNTWCQDNDLNWFSWKQWEHQKSDLFRFFSLLNHFRLNNPLLRQENFLTAKDITWHGAHPGMPDWSPMSKLVAFTLHDNSNEGKHLYIAFNASHVPITVHLPVPGKKTWYRIIDSSCESPEDFLEPGQERAIYPKALEHEPSYKLKPYSSILCQLKSSNRLHK